jgi:dihydropyrimidine dehydrogenase (NADP+)
LFILPKIVTGKELGTNGFTVESLRKDGYLLEHYSFSLSPRSSLFDLYSYAAIFLGIGMPKAKVDRVFEKLTTKEGFYTSKDFLPQVSAASKPGMCGCKKPQVQLTFF